MQCAHEEQVGSRLVLGLVFWKHVPGTEVSVGQTF